MKAPREARWDLPSDLEAVGKGRQMVRETLTGWGILDRGLVEDALIVVSELYTNAVQYGAQPITMSMCLIGRCLGGEISDHGPIFDRPPHANSEDEHGRGLQLVEALVTRWGIDPAKHGPGKAVWFRRCW